ncbi:DUF2929 family protein [Virgibacillus siamensis]|uniref:DUF2929 family protein n=1 Tax=Virgibacillus siamensis TaxID=480071 RepID=UPI00098690CE|nr:DUF2929 family protein [Virgibacillus siamensis]
MRFIAPLIWAFFISCVISYVLTSMGGTQFHLPSTIALAIILTIGVFLLGEGVLKKGESEQ